MENYTRDTYKENRDAKEEGKRVADREREMFSDAQLI